MSVSTKPSGYHLTPIGGGRYLLEPSSALDISSSETLLEEILQRLQRGKAQKLYYDLADLPLIEARYYQWLNMLARACCAVNVAMACIRMQPTAAYALSSYMESSPDFSVEQGVREG
jgi:rsbT antagonist protein RsbS